MSNSISKQWELKALDFNYFHKTIASHKWLANRHFSFERISSDKKKALWDTDVSRFPDFFFFLSNDIEIRKKVAKSSIRNPW